MRLFLKIGIVIFLCILQGQLFSFKIQKINDGKVGPIAIDSFNNVYIVYNSNNYLKCTKWDGISWSTITIDYVGYYSSKPSIKIDKNNNLHIAYALTESYLYYGKLKYAKWDGVSFTTYTVDDNISPSYLSIAVDSLNNPHISYQVKSDLKYATWTGTTWSTQTIDTGGVGSYTSIAIDNFNKPHISYYDYLNGDLKYIKMLGTSWFIQKVDVSGDVGKYTSIAVGTDGSVHIVYYDSTKQKIKYAKQYLGSWNLQEIDEGYGYSYAYLKINSLDNLQVIYNVGMIKIKQATFLSSLWNIKEIFYFSVYSSEYSEDSKIFILSDDLNRLHMTYERSGKIFYGIFYTTIEQALDNDQIQWQLSGQKPWFGQTEVYYKNGSAIQSGIISNDETSIIYAKIKGPGILSFWWKVSCEKDFDYLAFYIDNKEQDRISGEVNWQKKIYHISKDAMIEWAYKKDGSGSGGKDAGWLDNIEFLDSEDNKINIYHPVCYTSQNEKIYLVYNIINKTSVEISVYDFYGRKIIVLERGEKDVGRYTIEWNGKVGNNSLSSGAYLVVFKAGNVVQKEKIVIIR